MKNLEEFKHRDFFKEEKQKWLKKMSGECDKCNKHALECDCIHIILRPPNGKTFKECNKCKNPFIYDGSSESCLWCKIKE